MPKKDTPKILSKLPKPSRFLLADENWEDYEYRLQCLVHARPRPGGVPGNMIYRNEDIFHPKVEKCYYWQWGAWS